MITSFWAAQKSSSRALFYSSRNCKAEVLVISKLWKFTMAVNPQPKPNELKIFLHFWIVLGTYRYSVALIRHMSRFEAWSEGFRRLVEASNCSMKWLRKFNIWYVPWRPSFQRFFDDWNPCYHGLASSNEGTWHSEKSSSLLFQKDSIYFSRTESYKTRVFLSRGGHESRYFLLRRNCRVKTTVFVVVFVDSVFFRLVSSAECWFFCCRECFAKNHSDGCSTRVTRKLSYGVSVGQCAPPPDRRCLYKFRGWYGGVSHYGWAHHIWSALDVG